MKSLFLSVFLHQENHKQKVGELAHVKQDIFFEYDADFLKNGIPLSPLKLPLKPGIQSDNQKIFSGLPGVFYDSLPDGWGLLLMDRHFRKMGADPFRLSPLERLAYMGDRAMGALSYEPSMPVNYKWQKGLNLPKLIQDCERILQGHEDDILPELIIAGGSPGGARPKVLVGYCQKNHSICAGVSDIPAEYSHYLIKFSALTEPEDASEIEYAYAKMAKDCGIIVPENRLFVIKNYGTAFGIQRFDREQNHRIHMHSLSGLLHANFRIPNLDYADFLMATWIITKDIAQVKQAFRQMVFNVIFHNRDDHSKNFAFIYKNNSWQLSPAYDLTFSTGVGGEHTMTVAGEGANPGKPHFLRIAEKANITKKEALLIIDQIVEVRSRWLDYAKSANVGTKIAKKLEKITPKI